MPQSLSAVHLHLAFSTKERRPYLRDGGLRSQVHAYLGRASRELDCPPVVVGGTQDHVHALCRLGRTIAQADWVKELKRVSSSWIKKQEVGLERFAWQAGYGVFSVSGSNVGKVAAYIRAQEEHHRRTTFQEEFRDLLRKHGIEWDERYVWD